MENICKGHCATPHTLHVPSVKYGTSSKESLSTLNTSLTPVTRFATPTTYTTAAINCAIATRIINFCVFESKNESPSSDNAATRAEPAAPRGEIGSISEGDTCDLS